MDITIPEIGILGEAACRLRVLGKARGERKKPLPKPKTLMGEAVIEDIEGFEEAYRKAGGKYPIYDDYEANLGAATKVVTEAQGESGRGRKEAK